ncbi:hypothetical protein VXS04_13430 [Photobacterium piscicola]|uniref:hypothetical protein n=1 Tax=Photobacterium piscicola TaxID=1378299 RepID=UPI002E186AE5|nr:hypothetical protein [Photobacterium piscicola]
MFGEIESFCALVDRVKKFFKNHSNPGSDKELLSTRLVQLYEAHGVHRNQIPKVIGQGLTLYDVSTDERLLKKLTDKILSSTCQLFGINRDWLDGASDEIYPTYDFYKCPAKFEAFLSSLLAKSGSDGLDGILLSAVDSRVESVLILQETIDSINEKPYYRYYLCSGWFLSYWKSTGYITACVAMCWKNNVYVYGLYVDKATVDKYAHGNNLLDFGYDGIYQLSGIRWYPEDLALVPETYLKNINPEENQFGLNAALSLWFKLYHQGYLDTPYMDNNVELSFNDAHKKFS